MRDRPLSGGGSLCHTPGWIERLVSQQGPHRWRVLKVGKSIPIPPTLMAVDDASEGYRALRREERWSTRFLTSGDSDTC